MSQITFSPYARQHLPELIGLTEHQFMQKYARPSWLERKITYCLLSNKAISAAIQLVWLTVSIACFAGYLYMRYGQLNPPALAETILGKMAEPTIFMLPVGLVSITCLEVIDHPDEWKMKTGSLKDRILYPFYRLAAYREQLRALAWKRCAQAKFTDLRIVQINKLAQFVEKIGIEKLSQGDVLPPTRCQKEIHCGEFGSNWAETEAVLDREKMTHSFATGLRGGKPYIDIKLFSIDETEAMLRLSPFCNDRCYWHLDFGVGEIKEGRFVYDPRHVGVNQGKDILANPLNAIEINAALYTIAHKTQVLSLSQLASNKANLLAKGGLFPDSQWQFPTAPSLKRELIDFGGWQGVHLSVDVYKNEQGIADTGWDSWKSMVRWQ